MAPEETRRFGYQPALDGLRGLAVAAVLLFHAKVSWLPGGYVGVSVFFTLSGFLITSLLLGEHRSTGRIAAGAFYARRARRLLPASAACLIAVSVLAALGAFEGVPHLRRDVVGAALQVFNWVQLSGGQSYADLFRASGGAVNPLDHYWSLAIEEQFYWVWPVAFTGLAALARRRNASMVTTLAVPAAAFVALAPAIGLVWGPDAAYWATPARIGEILTGAVAAALVADGRVPRWAHAVAAPALAAIAVACATFPSGSGPAYGGWLPALSVVTAVALLGLQGDGPARAALSWRPLVALGTISYGVYLYHWPVFALVDEGRLGRSGWMLLAARFALTGAVAVASHLLLERPIRRATLPAARTLWIGAGATAVVAAVSLVIPAPSASYLGADAADERAAIDTRGDGTLPPLTGTTDVTVTPNSGVPVAIEAPTPSRPVRIVVVGDSTAEAVGVGLSSWAAANPALAQVTLVTAPGCGFVLGGARVFPEGDQEVSPACATYVAERVPDQVAELRPDVVLLLSAWDTADRRWDGGPVEAPTDVGYTERIDRDFTSLTDAVLDAGAPRVVWVKEPTTDPFWNPAHSPTEEPERHGVLWATMDRLADRDPEHVATADLAGWYASTGLAEDRSFRPDGVHVAPDAAERLARDWLGPTLLLEALRAG